MLDLITILGPTASGKTSLAVALAAHLDTEIISADSRQIYRSMDIGTGKDLSEYTYEGHAIPYHLIDICPPGYKYNLFEYIRDYNTAYADIIKRGKTPILCGGTGLYIEAVLKGYSLPPVPENKALRENLAEKSLSEGIAAVNNGIFSGKIPVFPGSVPSGNGTLQDSLCMI